MLDQVRNSRKVIVKVGSAAIIDAHSGIKRDCIDQLARQIVGLSAQGRQILLVSSGAVAAGRRVLRVKANNLHDYQAAPRSGKASLTKPGCKPSPPTIQPPRKYCSITPT